MPGKNALHDAAACRLSVFGDAYTDSHVRGSLFPASSKYLSTAATCSYSINLPSKIQRVYFGYLLKEGFSGFAVGELLAEGAAVG